MRASRLLFAFLFAASSVAASPVITSVTPAKGPSSGGWGVVIQGTGFSNNCDVCSPPFATPDVFFGSTRAESVVFFNESGLQAVAPPHAAGTVSVTVTQNAGAETFTLPNAFTYVDDLYEAFDPILFPIFSPPVHGQGGSEFRTTATVWNTDLPTATLYGMDAGCAVDPPVSPKHPFRIGPGGPEQNLFPECSETAGRLFFVPKGDNALATSLRVWEVTRQEENHGVEIPVVRRSDFSEDPIGLLSVPNDPKFRLTLRVYGLNRGATTLTIFIYGDEGQVRGFHQIPLMHNADPFLPTYAVFTAFPNPATIDDEKLKVMVGIARGPGDVVPPATPLWAFITVTNNVTQHITTITP
jgi:hypothetical protein